MKLEHLQAFALVAEKGSFAAAARLAGRDPSLVSRSVAALEEDLGLRLFHRTTRKLTLTEAGQGYFDRVSAILGELEDAGEKARDLSSVPRGRLRLAASVAFGESCLVPLIPAFRKQYPEIQIELVLSDTVTDLVDGRIDLAIRLAPAIQGDLICSKLRPTRYRVCASPAYLAKAGTLERPGQIGDHDCVLFDLPDYRDRWLFRGSDGQIEMAPVRGSVVISNALATKRAMLIGTGPAMLADWLIDADIQAGRCVDLFPQYEVAATTFDTAAWLVYQSRRFLPAKVRGTIDFLRTNLGSG